MKNPPSFQFYPQDFLSDLNVQSMSDEEVGMYWKLVCHCWIEDGLPADGTSRVVEEYFKKSPTVARCFVEVEGKYRNKRLDEEREKQLKWREKCSVGGKHSAESKKLRGRRKGSSTRRQLKANTSSSSSSSLLKKDFKKNLSGQDLKKNIDPRYLELARYLEAQIQANVPHHKFQGKNYLESWARQFWLMETRDKIPFESIQAVLEWSQSDEFWKINILSAGTFREKYGRLEAKARTGGNGRGEYKVSQVGKNTKPPDPRTDEAARVRREIYQRNREKAESRLQVAVARMDREGCRKINDEIDAATSREFQAWLEVRDQEKPAGRAS